MGLKKRLVERIVIKRIVKEIKDMAKKRDLRERRVDTEAEAVETIGEFLKRLGYDDYEEASKQFPHLLKRVKENYRQEIKSFEKQIERQEEHLKTIPQLAYEEDRKRAKRDTNDYMAHCLLAVRWFEHQIVELQEEAITQAMIKIMNECERQNNYDNHVDIEGMEHVLIKELPDSEHVLIKELSDSYYN